MVRVKVSDLKLFKFGTAVSFTVQDTLLKLEREYRLKWEMVIDDACHHFEYDLMKICSMGGYSMFGNFKNMRIKSGVNLKNGIYSARVFWNVGPGKIINPVEMDVGDVLISRKPENYFSSDLDTVIFYRELRTDV
jgi:hypothetical protein